MRGLWFLSKEFLMNGVLPFSFRPLAGIMVLIEADKMDEEKKIREVSVPLRGLWFLSPTGREDKSSQRDAVSVPLRGLWFLSR